jgi:hypothetical protein
LQSREHGERISSVRVFGPMSKEGEMNRLLVIALIVVAAFAGAAFAGRSTGTAASASSPDPRIRVLQSQVKALQADVKKLQKRDDQLDAYNSGALAGSTCLGAIVADLFQGTWGVIDQISQGVQQKTYFGPQTSVPDYTNCESLRNPMVPRPGIVVPPTITPLLPLLRWLHQ